MALELLLLLSGPEKYGDNLVSLYYHTDIKLQLPPILSRVSWEWRDYETRTKYSLASARFLNCHRPIMQVGGRQMSLERNS